MNMLTLDCKIKRWSINGFTFPFQTNTFAVEAGAVGNFFSRNSSCIETRHYGHLYEEKIRRVLNKKRTVPLYEQNYTSMSYLRRKQLV